MPEDTTAQVWKDIEDYLVPLLRLRPSERAIYAYLLRHSWLEGRRTTTITMADIARAARLKITSTRANLRQLARKGCIRLEMRKVLGMRYRVFLPLEIVTRIRRAGYIPVPVFGTLSAHRKHSHRRAVLRMQQGRCFYCRRRLRFQTAIIDHVVALVHGGSPGEENMVASCYECNLKKKIRSAPDFLRQLFRENFLSRSEFQERMLILRAILRRARRAERRQQPSSS